MQPHAALVVPSSMKVSPKKPLNIKQESEMQIYVTRTSILCQIFAHTTLCMWMNLGVTRG